MNFQSKLWPMELSTQWTASRQLSVRVPMSLLWEVFLPPQLSSRHPPPALPRTEQPLIASAASAFVSPLFINFLNFPQPEELCAGVAKRLRQSPADRFALSRTTHRAIIRGFESLSPLRGHFARAYSWHPAIFAEKKAHCFACEPRAPNLTSARTVLALVLLLPNPKRKQWHHLALLFVFRIRK